MIVRREIARTGDRALREVELVGVSGQIYSLSYEVDGPETLYFSTREEAEAAFRGTMTPTDVTP